MWPHGRFARARVPGHWQNRRERLRCAPKQPGNSARASSRIQGPYPMPSSKDAIIDSLIASFKAGKASDAPYRHWIVERCLPKDTIADIIELPFPAPELGGVSGKREVHNATRRYFDAENMARFPVCKATNEALQDRRATRRSNRSSASTRKAAICASSMPRTPTASGSSRTPTSASSCSRSCSTFRPMRNTAISELTSTTQTRSMSGARRFNRTAR